MNPLARTRRIALTLVALAGCGGPAEEAPEPIAEAPARSTNLGKVVYVHGDTVQVRMDEYAFAIPEQTVSAGPYVLHIQNMGFEYHDLQIFRDDSLLHAFPTEFAPGVTRYLRFEFEEGRYEFVCTMSGHDTKGMRVWFDVRPEES